MDVANALGVTLTEAQRFLREWRPKAAAALDAVEAALEAVDTASEEGAEIVSISFGGPTRRQREAGFWSWPVRVLLDGQEVGRVVADENGRWVASGQVKILAVEHAAGYHGGCVSMRLAVPAGAKAYHGEVI